MNPKFITFALNAHIANKLQEIITNYKSPHSRDFSQQLSLEPTSSH